MHRTQLTTFLPLAALFVCALTSATYAVAPGTRYLLTDLGVVPGATSSSAVAINDVGQVTGGSDLNPFLWSSATGIVDLGIPAGYTSAYGAAINDSGQI